MDNIAVTLFNILSKVFQGYQTAAEGPSELINFFK